MRRSMGCCGILKRRDVVVPVVAFAAFTLVCVYNYGPTAHVTKPVDISTLTGHHAAPIEISVQTEHRAAPIEISAQTEHRAAPIENSAQNERHAAQIENSAQTGHHVTPMQMQLESKEVNFAEMSMADRRRFVAKRCEEVRKWNKGKQLSEETNVSILLDTSQKLIACNNLKAGSSSLTYVLYHLSNLTGSKIDQRTFRRSVLMKSYPPRRVNNFPYAAILFVRDPLVRLRSAYRDHRGTRMINGKREPFESFLSRVVKVDNVSLIDPHHLSYFNTCRPCEVDYDYIGTTETYDQDFRTIFQQLGLSVDSVPHENNKKVGKTNIDNLPDDLKRAVWERYKEDYYIFGYEPSFTHSSLVIH